MGNKSIKKVMKGLGITTTFIILTSLLGEYVISREVNGYLQLAAIGVWLYVSLQLSKMFYKLI
jgi:hypothetical protein